MPADKDDTKINVTQALAAVMAEMPGIGKNQRNKDQGYAFRGIEDITAILQPLLGKHGVTFVPWILEWNEKEITLGGKPWTEQRLLVEYTIYGPAGDFISCRVTGIGRDNSDKGANKAMAQAYKYALMQVLCIGDAKDDGDGETHAADTPTPPPPPPLMSQTNQQAAINKAEQMGLDFQARARAILAATGGRTDQITQVYAAEVALLRAAFTAAAEAAAANGADQHSAEKDATLLDPPPDGYDESPM